MKFFIIFLVFEAIAISRCYLYTYLVPHRETLFTTEMAAVLGDKLISTTINLDALTEDSKVNLPNISRHWDSWAHCTC